MNYIKGWLQVAVSLCVLMNVGCSGIGPTTLVPSRFDYTAAIGDSWKQQMLINTVKMRYGDPPVFLDVSSVISQYQIAASASWGGLYNNQSSSNTQSFGVTGTASDGISQTLEQGAAFGSPFISSAQNFGVTGVYADRPTITYVPLSGEKFTRTLIKPIPPASILSIVEAGYPIDLVLRVCVHSVNGVRNRYGGSSRAHPADPEFYPMLERMRRIQDSGAIGIRVRKTKEAEGMVMTFRGRVSASVKEDSDAVRKALGLDPEAGEFRIAYGSSPQDQNEIAFLTRSMLEMIVEISSCIEVPEKHVEEKRVNATMPDDVVAGTPVPPLIRIKSSRLRPADAFLAVPYRNHWFWIDDRDMQSKSLFSFMMVIFSLNDSDDQKGAPLITIPSG